MVELLNVLLVMVEVALFVYLFFCLEMVWFGGDGGVGLALGSLLVAAAAERAVALVASSLELDCMLR